MKIAFVLGVFFPQPGGAQVQFHNLANSLIETGNDVDCYIYRKTNIKNNNYKIFILDYLITSLVYFFHYYVGINLNFILKIYLKKIIKKKRYDLWHFNYINYKSLILINSLKELNQKVIVTFQGADIQIHKDINYGARLNVKYNKLLKKIINNVDFFTSISKNISIDLNNLGILNNKIFFFPNCVNQSKFDSVSDVNALADQLTFITVGRFAEKKKGFDLIKDIVEILNKKEIQFKWKIIGQGVNEILKYKEIKDNINEFDIIENIENIDETYFPNTKLIKEYKSSDIYLNLSRVESFGITFIETLASGTPIISFNTKGANEIINSNHNGFIIKDFNLDDFVQKIEQIKNDRTILKKIKQNSKSSVKKYDLNYNTKLLNNFYLRIITT
jgi:glycosyltransferase involved in cell wall biosynthesis